MDQSVAQYAGSCELVVTKLWWTQSSSTSVSLSQQNQLMHLTLHANRLGGGVCVASHNHEVSQHIEHYSLFICCTVTMQRFGHTSVVYAIIITHSTNTGHARGEWGVSRSRRHLH